ncbi:hypothetical protein CDAR_602401 [Caerostris darwini]|uniref:Uncharacterized protein n=1 Tax=Caerostris darwini TaxID=1538125 RepID=A0AAV4TXV5_9ARAC|nr:hypothetical protein CDAR_602401 [Caerostris darwini]
MIRNRILLRSVPAAQRTKKTYRTRNVHRRRCTGDRMHAAELHALLAEKRSPAFSSSGLLRRQKKSHAGSHHSTQLLEQMYRFVNSAPPIGFRCHTPSISSIDKAKAVLRQITGCCGNSGLIFYCQNIVTGPATW